MGRRTRSNHGLAVLIILLFPCAVSDSKRQRVDLHVLRDQSPSLAFWGTSERIVFRNWRNGTGWKGSGIEIPARAIVFFIGIFYSIDGGGRGMLVTASMHGVGWVVG
ncbi:hypothetical protein B0J14DRAFT_341640 [Halenospora varia]|nr:hypothetical protein B0J14DRAFT_341640 [Halenospora varia]